jgi:hypothetical protein
VFIPELASLMNQLPFRARWHLGLVVVSFVVAVLAGFGTEAVVRSPRDWTMRVWCCSGFAVLGLMTVALWFIGRGSLGPRAARLRTESFIWPTILIVLGLVVVGVLSRGAGEGSGAGPVSAARRIGAGRWAGAIFLAAETAFLVGVGAPLWSSSPTYLTTTPALTALATGVGSSRVGFGQHSCELPPTLGILPETNAAFGVHELSAYDPITPRAYFTALHLRPGVLVSSFCPVIKTVTEARRYGVKYILEPKGVRGPRGAVFDKVVGDEDLFRVPDVGAATLTPVPADGTMPKTDARGTVVPVSHPDPSSWRMVTTAKTPKLLRLRLTDVPGWHASIDGRPLRLERFAGIMLQAPIPPGTHVVELHYWPETFTVGIVCAAIAAAGLAVAVYVAWRRRPVARTTAPGGADGASGR